jgi:DNA-directed RNA polymerase subunit RPC12/RpoP
MIACSKCGRENDDDASFCDQCGAALERVAQESEAAEAASSNDEEGDCPDCGGRVEEVEEGKGVCVRCGAELIAKEGEAAPAAVELSPGQKLSRIIKLKLAAGMPIDFAIDSGCEEFLADPANPQGADAQPAKAELVACPVCGQENEKSAARCGGCGIVFKARGITVECPRCMTPSSDGKCSCGAFLTLPKLLEVVDPSVMYVCPRCRQLFNAVTVNCTDCGAAVLLADRLKKHAAKMAA